MYFTLTEWTTKLIEEKEKYVAGKEEGIGKKMLMEHTEV